jgi:hypothetical protein
MRSCVDCAQLRMNALVVHSSPQRYAHNDVVWVVSVCWLRLDFVPLSLVLGALGSLRLLSIFPIHSVWYLRSCRL